MEKDITTFDGSGNRLSGVEWADSSDRTATAELWQTVFPLACFVLGKEKALPLLENNGADALLQMRTTRCILQKEWKSVLS